MKLIYRRIWTQSNGIDVFEREIVLIEQVSFIKISDACQEMEVFLINGKVHRVAGQISILE